MNKIFKHCLIAILFIACSSSAPTTDEEKDKVLMSIMLHSLNSGHFHPKEINNDFSKKAFDLYLKSLDVNKKFLVQSDIEKFKKFETEIDNEINAGTFQFFDLSMQVLDERVKEAESYYKEILSKPFNFSIQELVELDGDKLPFAKDKNDLKENWRKYLKYQTLIRLDELMDVQEKAREKKDTVIKVKTFAVMEQEAREKVLKSQNDWFHRLKQLDKNDRLSQYINSIVSTYDPHTNYFPPKEKENFDIALSGQLEGIGATLQEKDGYIKVLNIVPGSASWKQGQLKVGDVILKVGQAGQEPVDIVDMRIDDAVKLIRGKKGSEVRLTVKKIDASIVIIPIIRDIVVLEETYAKSAVLDNGKKVGYIKLPQFYADFNGKGGRSSAEDVRKEIAKLQEDNVQGLILDLRNNGGGSLQDAVTMGGLFINRGPIVQIKSGRGAPNVLEDIDPAVQYNGPLVILVNEFSASASEILAAAIQDYKRGVIVGSNTFGKGTVQRLIDLDEYLPENFEKAKPLGAVKLTTQKFYRVNGGATQLKGVAPDVTLPDSYTYLEMGEKELEYPMPWDEISAAKYQSSDRIKNIEEIKKNSKLRIASNSAFQLEDENGKRLKAQSGKSSFQLNLEKFREEQHKIQKEAKKFENVFKEIPGLNVQSTISDAKNMPKDTAQVESLKAWQKNIKKDPYIFESMAILKEMK
ncbi:MAG TPA: carboxy terminal-processing peptidase [Cytophagaceae bacterium]